LKKKSHETGPQSLHSESSQQLCQEYEEFAQMPSHDKFPQEADVTAFVQKRIRDFSRLQGLIQKNINADPQKGHLEVIKDAAVL